MAKGPTRQHYVPQCYLREWAASDFLFRKTSYLWTFNKGEKKGRKSSITNVFVEKDLYTLKLKSGEKNYSIEETLATLEGKYAALFKDKISQRLPLTEDERITLRVFVAAMLQRTPRFRDNMQRFHDQLMEQMSPDVTPEERQGLKQEMENGHKLNFVQLLPDVAMMLMDMNIAFLCSDGGAKYITSDDPCQVFNPELQWQRAYGPDLGQERVEVYLPLSPEILLCMSRSPLRGYVLRDKTEVEESNRMTVGHSYKYFIANSSRARRHWYRRYPLDFFFILKILRHQASMRWHELKLWYQYRHVTKR